MITPLDRHPVVKARDPTGRRHCQRKRVILNTFNLGGGSTVSRAGAVYRERLTEAETELRQAERRNSGFFRRTGSIALPLLEFEPADSSER